MRLAILGGGGFRTPLVYAALAGGDSGVTEVALHDTDPDRLAVMAHVLVAAGHPGSVSPGDGSRRTWTRARGRRLRLLGDPGGRTRGAGAGRARRARSRGARPGDHRSRRDRLRPAHDPGRPAGRRARASRRARRVGHQLHQPGRHGHGGHAGGPRRPRRRDLRHPDHHGQAGGPPPGRRPAYRRSVLDYVGLNHLGWLRGLQVDGTDLLPSLLADDALLGATEEGQLFGRDWIRQIGALPNEYLYYYDFTRDAVASIRDGGLTRGEFLAGQQGDFYAAAAADPLRRPRAVDRHARGA